MSATSVHAAAVMYLELGWSVIPCRPGAKEPAISSWRKYQQTKPTIDEITKWFNVEQNVAIVGGDVSGMLVIRDFDSEDEYESWATREPRLATTLPTVKTGKGRHVYARIKPCPPLTVRDVPNGELRGAGSYVIAPPSVHPNGMRYEWLVRPSQRIPFVTLADFGLEHLRVGESTVAKQHSKHSPRSNLRSRSKPSTISIPSTNKHSQVIAGGLVVSIEEIENAVRLSLPSSTGQRNRRLFDLARRVKTLTGSEVEQKSLIEIFNMWWRLAEPIVATKDYGTSLVEFLRAFEVAEKPHGEAMRAYLHEAIQDGLPYWVPAHCSLNCKMLAALCRQLHCVHAPAPFFLSSRTAGELLGETYVTTSKWLVLFRKLGALRVVEPGNHRKGRAAQYFYLKDDIKLIQDMGTNRHVPPQA